MKSHSKAPNLFRTEPELSFRPGSTSTAIHSISTASDTDEEEYIPLRRVSKVLQPHPRPCNNEFVPADPGHGASHSPLQSSAAEESFTSAEETIPEITTSQDDDSSSKYGSDEDYSSGCESDDDSVSFGTSQDNGGVSQSGLLKSLGKPMTLGPFQPDEPNLTASAHQNILEAQPIGRSSTVKHIHRSSTRAAAPIYTLKPDEALRANPQGRIDDHMLVINQQWDATRDTVIAAPFLAKWLDHEVQLSQAAKAAYAAHLHRQIKADKAWLLRKLCLKASDWLAIRQQRRAEVRRRSVVRARLNKEFVAQQLAHRKEVVESHLSSAALEMSSGDEKCGRLLRDAYLGYLSEDAGRLFLPIRAELNVGEDVNGEANRVPRWLDVGYQMIDCGDGRQEAFIVRYFC